MTLSLLRASAPFRPPRYFSMNPRVAGFLQSASVGPVDDETACHFLERFHRGVIVGGKNVLPDVAEQRVWIGDSVFGDHAFQRGRSTEGLNRLCIDHQVGDSVLDV